MRLSNTRQPMIVWDESDYAPVVITPWVRPTDWLPVPAPESAVSKITGLWAITNTDTNYIAFSISTNNGGYQVDWGDGVVETFASAVTAQHKYNWEDISADTLTSEGYRQVLIQITPVNAGATLTVADLALSHNQPGLPTNLSTMWLDISSSNITSYYQPSSTNKFSRLLQRLRHSGNLSPSASAMFYNCSNLRVVELPAAFRPDTMQNMFYGCYRLEEIPLWDMSNCVSLSSAFAQCRSLKKTPAWSTPVLTRLDGTFNGCFSLVEIEGLDTSKVTTWSFAFASCNSLVKTPAFDFAAAQNLSSVFQSCPALQEVGNITAPNAQALSNMFQGCYALKSVGVLTVGPACTSVQSLFSNCSALRTFGGLVGSSKVTNFSQMFGGCWVLEAVPLFDTSSGTNFSSMFAGVFETLPNFDFSKATSLSSTFGSCPMLKRIPPVEAPLCTNMSFMAGSLNHLEEIVSLDMSANTSGVGLAPFSPAPALVRFGGHSAVRSFSLSWAKLDRAAIIEVFNNLGVAIDGSQTVTVTNNPGVPHLTAEDRAIATAKGWTVSA